MRGYRPVLLLIVLVGTGVGGCFEGPAPPSTPSASPPSAFVGSEVCALCHAALVTNFQATPHGRLLQTPAQEARRWGCETCHGPGGAHVNTGGGKGAAGLVTFHTEAAETRAGICLTCHQQNVEWFQFRRSEHKLAGVACNDCHTLHPARQQAHLLKQPMPELCFACHQDVRHQFALPVHHKVLEGVVGCTDCHAAHGSMRRVTLRSVHQETCVRCHIDKGGPFAFEHLASRIEGCTACHTPHGSTNKFLLKRREERVLCLECHSDAPLFHNQAPGAFFRGACTRCHTQIHGSHIDRLFFR